MSRKFTAGRQSDMLLNEKLHNLYTHLEFISYKDGENNTITMPKQTRQTAIPKGALWLQQPNESQVNKLRVHTNPEASDVDTRWPCLFEGYYHPATLTELPTNPVHGQLWVDDKNILRIYNDKGAEGQWVPVATELVANVNYDVFNGMDFQSIDPLLPNKSDDTMYSVPYESFGKFYAAESHEDEFIYCHPSMDETIASKVPSYNMLTNEGSIEIQGDTLDYLAKAWVHVNPYNLNRVTKRLIKINKPEILYKTAESCINIPKSYYEDEKNKDKTFLDCLLEHIIEKTNESGDTIKVVYVDENNRLVNLKNLYETMPIEMPEDDLDSGMNIEPLDPNPIPDNNYDEGMNNNEYQEIPPEDYDNDMNVEPLDPNPVPDNDYDEGINNDEYVEIPPDDYDSDMNVEPLDPNPIPGDDFDAGMNNDEYQEIPPDDYDGDMNVEPLDPNPTPDNDYDNDMNVDWEMPIVTEIIVLEVVSDSTKLSEYDMNTMVKASIANSKKYNETITLEVGEYVIPVEFKNQYTYFIGVPAGKTEYFAFKSSSKRGFDNYGNRIGRFLKHYNLKEGLSDEIVNNDPTILDHRNDYEVKNGGILLDDEVGKMYDYIYAISYEFKQDHVIDGSLLRITKPSLDGPDQMWIGPCTGIPVVFMDGLYLEHRADYGDVYKYENENIIFSGNVILDEMQILVVSFPKVNTYLDGNGEHPKEYTIDERVLKERYVICDASDEKALQVVESAMSPDKQISYTNLILQTPSLKDVVDMSGNFYVKNSGILDAVVQGDINDTVFDEENFPNPLIFYNGLAGYTFVANEVEIDYENKTITIFDFGAINSSNGTSAIFAVSLGKNNYKANGVLEDGVLYDPNVSADKDYLVIVDGIVMSPYNEDITIEEVEIINENGESELVGKITITDATVALDSEYTIIELTNPNDDLTQEQNEDGIMCVYDDIFTPYTIPLAGQSMNTSNAYDNCDSAIVMCGPGALVDRASVLREFDPNDTFVGGQITKNRLKSTDGKEIYEYRMYTYSNEYVVLDPLEDAITIADCENMITYHVSDGTVMLNPVGMEDEPVTVYAYTYIDSVDEKLLQGRRVMPIETPGHANASTSVYSTNRTHLYDLGVNALSTYLNGVMIPHMEETTTDVKSDIFFVDKPFSSMFIPFVNRYEVEQTDNRFVDQDMFTVLQAIEEDMDLTSEIIVTDKYGIQDHCLVMKYFNSEYQLEQAKALKRYLNNDMRNNRLLYLIENVEANEMVSSRRQWKAPRNDNGNLPNSYTTTMRLAPGIINVYVNGVLLDKEDYAVFDSNKIVIGFDLVGGQEILPKNKGDYKHPYRVLTDEGFKFIECEGDDEVLIEVRDDLTIKKRSYEIKDISYETYSFDILDYEYPSSLSSTKDLIKIYINGVLYDGNYTNINGVITLLECDLEQDPLYKHLKMYPDLKAEYEAMYGEYVKHEDIITFEWR